MKTNISIIAIAFCAACSRVPEEPGPGPGVVRAEMAQSTATPIDGGPGLGIDRVDSAPSATIHSDRVPTRYLVGDITDEDIEDEVEAPMLGELPGLGRFKADARIRLSETRVGMPLAELLLSGITAAGDSVGLSQDLTPEQARRLIVGERVEFDGARGVGYGMLAVEIMQSVLAARMSSTESGLVSIRFELGNEIGRSVAARSDFGGAAELVIRGTLQFDCMVPGPNGQRERALEDPHLQTEFCRQMVTKYGLQTLVEWQ